MRVLAPNREAARAVLSARLEARRAALAASDRRDQLLANVRLSVFLAGTAVGVGCYAFALWPWQWVLPWLAAFGGAVVWHAQVIERSAALKRRVRVYEDALCRCAGTCPPGAPTGPRVTSQHPFAGDLDIFGPDGLFGLLCTATTGIGQQTLLGWLQTPPASRDAAPLQARQAAVVELLDALDLREDLGALRAPTADGLRPEVLRRWAQMAPPSEPVGLGLRLWTAHAAVAAATVLWALGLTSGAPLLAVMGLQWLLLRPCQRYVAAVMAALEAPRQALPLLAAVMSRLCAHQPSAPALRDAFTKLHTAGLPAHEAVAALGRLGQWYDAGRNQVFAPLAWLLGWGPHFARRAEAWRLVHGAQLPAWLAAVGELEAYVALGGYGFEQADDVFAHFVDADAEGGPQLIAKGLGHPLLPRQTAVRNDLTLDAQTRLLIVSGSNMSGKSTLLRAVGCAVVLAQCGAPVRAAHLTMCPLSLGATLRVQDSLQAGVSRFYAELQRLRQVRDLLSGAVPLLFLLDEILHGTNSHDRAIGSEAILRMLLAGGSLGLVTTHDLSLSHKAAALGATNVHFADDWLGESLHFDYKMRPGVVQHSNALALMRKEGLI